MIETLDNETNKDIDEVVDKVLNNDNDVKDNNKELNEDVNDNLNHADDTIDNVDDEDGFDYELNEDNLMLTTIDNPYDPKTQYDEWKQWDNEQGYDTEEYIARLVHMEEDYDVDDEFLLNILTTKVINEILENDSTNLYRLI